MKCNENRCWIETPRSHRFYLLYFWLLLTGAITTFYSYRVVRYIRIGLKVMYSPKLQLAHTQLINMSIYQNPNSYINYSVAFPLKLRNQTLWGQVQTKRDRKNPSLNRRQFELIFELLHSFVFFLSFLYLLQVNKTKF